MKRKILIAVFALLISNLYSQIRYSTIFNLDTISFENPYTHMEVDSSIQNIWQIGTPRKIFFDSAYSNDKAILTDSVFTYPINNYSWFDLFIGTFNYDYYYPGDIFIEFKHKFDTDTLRDGGYLTISYDKGKTWMNIINDSVYYSAKPGWESENLYSSSDTLFNGEKGFSGRSNGWISTWFAWHYIPVKKNNTTEIGDTMILRFNFISDGLNTNKEGWLIDDIRLFAVDLGGGIDYLQKELSVKIYPNPINSTSIINLNKQYKNIIVSIINLEGQTVYTEQYFERKIIPAITHKVPSGLYFIKILIDKEFLIYEKVVVE